MIKTYFIMKNISRLRIIVRVAVKFIWFCSKLAQIDPRCIILETSFGRRKYEEEISDERPLHLGTLLFAVQLNVFISLLWFLIIVRRVTREGGVGRSPLPFFGNWKKVPWFWQKMRPLLSSMSEISHLKCDF